MPLDARDPPKCRVRAVCANAAEPKFADAVPLMAKSLLIASDAGNVFTPEPESAKL